MSIHDELSQVVKREHDSADYDRMYGEGGHEGVFALPYRHSCYFPLFRRVLAELKRRAARRTLEVGCGSGAFAHYLLEYSAMGYSGFDFSPAAVERARQRTGRPELFSVADAKAKASYAVEHDAIVCTEVLEHIHVDREVVATWRPGTLCVCSVPNFDADDHVRHFIHEGEVRARYGDLIEIETLLRVRKPELTDISPASTWRALRWNRYRPRRIAAILGLAPFADGGWFLFAGRRTKAKA